MTNAVGILTTDPAKRDGWTRMGEGLENIQQPTSNIEHPMGMLGE